MFTCKICNQEKENSSRCKLRCVDCHKEIVKKRDKEYRLKVKNDPFLFTCAALTKIKYIENNQDKIKRGRKEYRKRKQEEKKRMANEIVQNENP